MLFQQPEASTPTSFEATISRIIETLNTPFIRQEGSFAVSIMSLILFVVIFLIGVVASRYINRFLQKRVMPRFTHMDMGLRYTLLKIVHYLILALALLWAIRVGFSVDLTGVAVILGFLSVGIGFGLQYLAADIASGFILLFERPLRVGDRLKLEDMVEGRVESIRLRSTVIMTNENLAVIVPNSKLTQNHFINYSYGRGQTVRINVPVGVAYGSDIKTVAKALVEAATSVKEVLPDPPPRPHFQEFGDSSLNFQVRVWINEPHKHPQIRSKINFAIDEAFRKYNIEIPFPQRDLHLRSGSIRISNDGKVEREIQAVIDEGE
ncbi:MAG TPA: mechanosensitive ion channel domain-containing protein [Blastocatellia bacterium]